MRLTNASARIHRTPSRPATRLGILSVWPIGGSMPGGQVFLFAEGWGAFAGDERTVGDWVTGRLSVHADVPAKLAAHPGVSERHAFIWARFNSDFGVQAQLEPGDDHPLPATPPTLSEGVRHVWVADSARHQGALAWFPDRGWWRTSWMPPADGPIRVEDLE